ncbi:MAG: caspase family protein [Candidatus Wallbacteria bacterium]
MELKIRLDLKLLALIFVFAFFILIDNAYGADKRYALVIGNADYNNVSKLKNTLNDAVAMETVLKTCGFNVMRGENLTKRQFKDLVDVFVSRMEDYCTVLFYYSGHGVQYRGDNYLVPVEVNSKMKSYQIEDECLKLNFIMDALNSKGAKFKIIILDACRNNPFDEATRSLTSKGLAQMKSSAANTLIAYSTSPDTVASDGDENNSPYVKALLKNITKPGIDIGKMFNLTRKEVISMTNNEQLPWETSSIIDEFFFMESAQSGSSAVNEPVPPKKEPGQDTVLDKPSGVKENKEPVKVISSENVTSGGETLAQAGKTEFNNFDGMDEPDYTAPPAAEITIYENGNIYGVDSNPRTVPQRPTEFKIKKSAFITHFETYHYFTNGAAPGKIALRHSDGTIYGPWQTSGRAGQGNVDNAYWEVKPNIEIKPGKYTVLDSNPATWSFNGASGSRGFVIIKGYYK